MALSQRLQIHIVHTLGEKRFSNSSCKTTLPIFTLLQFLLQPLYFVFSKKFLLLISLLSDCMSWIVFLKTGKCLPGSFSQRLATISTADECAETIIRFINDHAPGARELVFSFSFFLFCEITPTSSLLHFKSNIFLPTLSLLFPFHGSFLRVGGSNRGGSLNGPVFSGET